MVHKKHSTGRHSIKGFFLILLINAVFLFSGVVVNDILATETTASETTNGEEDGNIKEPDDYTKGKKLYDGLCSTCHGEKGDGKGHAYSFTIPKARDFTSGIYKFRSTPSGQPPTDEDFIRITKRGNPGTSMPAYGTKISDDDIMLVVNYIKQEFAPTVFKIKQTPYVIGDPPPTTPELIKQGREIYVKSDCSDCHGNYGRGDGDMGWNEDMKDTWGDRIYPADLTHPWELRNFATVKDLFRTLITGLDGTPMISYKSEHSEDELWALAHYLKSIQRERVTNNILPIKKTTEIPASTDDPLWSGTEYTDLTIGGKILFGHSLIPRATNARLRGVHTNSKIALMLEWNDKMPDNSNEKSIPDSAIMYFPSIIKNTNPWIDKGDRRSVFDVWKWNAADDRATEAVRKGSRESNKKRSKVMTVSTYKDGMYRVIFIRDKSASTEAAIKFDLGKEILYSVIINDGDNKERGNRGGVSGQKRIILE